MSTSVRPETSVKKPYWIDRHRYYELKHFCLQYPGWKSAYLSIDGHGSVSTSVIKASGDGSVSDPTSEQAQSRLYFSDRMQMIEKSVDDTSLEFGSYILRAVTEGRSYGYLKSKLGIPCCKEVYYELYRRFFWLLSQERN